MTSCHYAALHYVSTKCEIDGDQSKRTYYQRKCQLCSAVHRQRSAAGSTSASATGANRQSSDPWLELHPLLCWPNTDRPASEPGHVCTSATQCGLSDCNQSIVELSDWCVTLCFCILWVRNPWWTQKLFP